MQPTWTILLDQSTVTIVLHIYNNLPLYTNYSKHKRNEAYHIQYNRRST